MKDIVPILLFVLVAVAIPVSFLVRLAGAICRHEVREKILKRPVTHLVWFVAAAMGALSYVLLLSNPLFR